MRHRSGKVGLDRDVEVRFAQLAQRHDTKLVCGPSIASWFGLRIVAQIRFPDLHWLLQGAAGRCRALQGVHAHVGLGELRADQKLSFPAGSRGAERRVPAIGLWTG